MDAKSLLQERRELFDNVFELRHNSRTPTASNNSYWSIFDAGYTNVEEALYDYDKLFHVQDDFFARYQFDAHMNPKNFQSMRLVQGMDFGRTVTTENKDSIVVLDANLMHQDEYPALRNDRNGFYWSEILKRKSGEKLTVGQVKTIASRMMEMGVYTNKVTSALKNQHGQLVQWKYGNTMPFETIVSWLRGLKHTSLDMRQKKGELKETLNILFEQDCVPLLHAAAAYQGDDCITALGIPMMGYSILNRKQFEELYWPHLKRSIDFCVENNIRIFFYCEAEMLRFAEYFREIPKGTAILQIENDDIFEVRKALPNMALAGGMPVDMLYNGTKEQCENHARKLISEIGDGFVLTQDKMLCTKTDAKRENLLAVNEIARTYNG